jgi:hypothetical protein
VVLTGDVFPDESDKYYLRDAVLGLHADGACEVIIDMMAAPLINGAGIGMLVWALMPFSERSGGGFTIVPSPGPMSKVWPAPCSVFNFAASVEEALETIAETRKTANPTGPLEKESISGERGYLASLVKMLISGFVISWLVRTYLLSSE